MLIQTHSVAETTRIGRKIGSSLQPGDVVALVGDLGTGKTHFIKGLARGVGVEKSAYVSSPSFTLINEYPGKIPFYHLDLYRLDREKEAEELGLHEYFLGRGVTAVEWADRIPSLLPKELLWIHLHYLGKRSRSIDIRARGRRYQELVRKLFATDAEDVPSPTLSLQGEKAGGNAVKN